MFMCRFVRFNALPYECLNDNRTPSNTNFKNEEAIRGKFNSLMQYIITYIIAIFA